MDEITHDTTKVIHQALVLLVLGEDSAVPETSIAASAGPNTTGIIRPSTIWFPGKMKKTRKNPGQVIKNTKMKNAAT